MVSKAATELEKEGIDAAKLREVIQKLDAPLTADRAAQAFDKAKEARQNCPVTLEELGKCAMLVVREVLVLVICCCDGSMSALSDIGFEAALERAFGKQLGPELVMRSALHEERRDLRAEHDATRPRALDELQRRRVESWLAKAQHPTRALVGGWAATWHRGGL